MTPVTRHVGKTKNTDRRIVVAYMQIPGREDHALVIDTDALPAKYHDELMRIVQGEGQNEVTLANLLGRRIMASTGADMLSTLHSAGYLQAVNVDNVIMMPNPNQPVPLRTILQHMGHDVVKPVEDTEPAPNTHVENQKFDKNNERYQIARNIIAEAEMLEAEARRKREQAYAYCEELRPPQEAPKQVEVPVVKQRARSRAKV